jgi:hypothetical protein
VFGVFIVKEGLQYRTCVTCPAFFAFFKKKERGKVRPVHVNEWMNVSSYNSSRAFGSRNKAVMESSRVAENTLWVDECLELDCYRPESIRQCLEVL